MKYSQIIGGPFEKFEKNLFQKSKCTHVSSINLKRKVSDSKNIVAALVYFCSYPYGTPCTNKFLFQIGEVRAWQGACYVNHEIFIHSGCTQEFYSNRLELDDHAESVLKFDFGVKSLVLLCLENIENALDTNSKPILEEMLPLNLKNMLISRSLFNEGTML